VTEAPEEATLASEDIGIEMFEVMHLPICTECRKGVEFGENEGVVVGKCGCVKERVMTERQYIFFESFDVIAQSIILAGIEFKGEWPAKDVYAAKDILDAIVKREFGSGEMEKSVVLDKLLRWKMVQSL
jgi:hypothetical protein